MSEMQQVLEKLETIEVRTTDTNKKVDQILQWKAGMEIQCEAHRGKTEEVRVTLFGSDNSEGLKGRVARLWNCKGDLRNAKAKWQDFWMYVLKSLVVAGVIAIAILLFGVYKHLMNGGS